MKKLFLDVVGHQTMVYLEEACGCGYMDNCLYVKTQRGFAWSTGFMHTCIYLKWLYDGGLMKTHMSYLVWPTVTTDTVNICYVCTFYYK